MPASFSSQRPRLTTTCVPGSHSCPPTSDPLFSGLRPDMLYGVGFSTINVDDFRSFAHGGAASMVQLVLRVAGFLFGVLRLRVFFHGFALRRFRSLSSTDIWIDLSEPRALHCAFSNAGRVWSQNKGGLLQRQHRSMRCIDKHAAS